MKKTLPQRKALNREIIEKKLWKGSQSVHYREISIIDKLKFKFEIKSDSYKMQSLATADVWLAEKMEWSRIYSIPGLIMETENNAVYGLGRDEQPSMVTFSKDLTTLIDNTMNIIF